MKCNILSFYLLFIIAMIYSWITCVVQCPEGASLPSRVKRRCEIAMAKKRESDRDIMCVIILVLHVHSSCLITLLGPLSIPYSCSFRLYVHLWSLTTAQTFCSEIMVQMNRKRLSDG